MVIEREIQGLHDLLQPTPSESPVAQATESSDLSVDKGPLSDFFDELVTSCQIVTPFSKEKRSVIWLLRFLAFIPSNR